MDKTYPQGARNAGRIADAAMLAYAHLLIDILRRRLGAEFPQIDGVKVDLDDLSVVAVVIKGNERDIDTVKPANRDALTALVGEYLTGAPSEFIAVALADAFDEDDLLVPTPAA